MSILIKGLEMPSGCEHCPFCIDYWATDDKEEWRCIVNMHLIEFFDTRLDSCPLIEVPPHGDLIDRDALIKDGWLNLHKVVMRMGGYAIHELPLKNPSIAVIIPAEEGE